MRKLLSVCVFLALTLMHYSALAAVTPVTYFFYGQVSSASGNSNVPQPPTVVPISITVDTSFPAYSYQNGVALYRGGSANVTPSPILAATINGLSVHGIFDEITITDVPGGRHQIYILSYSPMGVFFSLTFTTTMSGVVHGIKIPRRIFPGNFQSAVFVNSLFEGIQYSGPIID